MRASQDARGAHGGWQPLALEVPSRLVEAIAERAAELVLARLEDEPQWLTLEEAAERYRTTPGALRKRAQRGQLPGAVKDGSRWLVDCRALDAALGGAYAPQPGSGRVAA